MLVIHLVIQSEVVVLLELNSVRSGDMAAGLNFCFYYFFLIIIIIIIFSFTFWQKAACRILSYLQLRTDEKRLMMLKIFLVLLGEDSWFLLKII